MASAARPSVPPKAMLEAQAGGISSWRLANGFKIILAPFPAAGTARVELLVKSGSKVEGYGESGMAHLLEHMLYKGAGARANLRHDLATLATRFDGTTTVDRTNFFETVPADPDKVDEALRIEADRFIRARFTRADLASEMTVVRNELEREDKDPWQAALRSLRRQTYFWHGYGRPNIGARSDIEGAPFAALQAFHRRHYRPDNAALIVSGRFDPERVLALATSLFSVARNPVEPRPASWTREEGQAVLSSRIDLMLQAGTTLAASAWKLPGLASRQRQALELALTAVCDPEWGSLWQVGEYRSQFGCGTDMRVDYSELIASANAEPQADAAALSTELVRHIEKEVTDGLSADRLEQARSEQLKRFERWHASHEAVAESLSDAEVAGDWRLLFWRQDMMREVTLDEANAALRAWIVPQNRRDVLLRHGDALPALVPPAPAPVSALIAGRNWPALVQAADAPPLASWAELARASTRVELGDPRGQAMLLSRQTLGDRVWLVLDSDWGNAAARVGRQTACYVAGRMQFGSSDRLKTFLEQVGGTIHLRPAGWRLEVPRARLSEALDLLLTDWAQFAELGGSLDVPPNPGEIYGLRQRREASESRFNAGRKSMITDLMERRNNLNELTKSLIRQRFDNFPAGHPDQPRSLEQQRAELQGLSYADVQACIADFGGLAHARLAVVGAIEPAEVRALWARIAQLPASRVGYEYIAAPAAPREVDTTPIVVAMPEQPNASVHGMAVLPISMESPDYPALQLAVKALGGQHIGRIWNRLREREGLSYDAIATLSNDTREPRSTLGLYASAASDKATVALASLQDELARALREGFSVAEIERARQVWQQARRTALSAEKSYAGALADGLLDGRDPAWQAEYDRRMAAVTAQQASAALRRYLGAAPLVWATGRGS